MRPSSISFTFQNQSLNTQIYHPFDLANCLVGIAAFPVTVALNHQEEEPNSDQWEQAQSYCPLW